MGRTHREGLLAWAAGRAVPAGQAPGRSILGIPAGGGDCANRDSGLWPTGATELGKVSYPAFPTEAGLRASV